jgi:Multimeric flavodoxin WrbA
MKNVLILSGSPRKGGNSDILCDQFAQGAVEAGNRVEKIRIQEKNIGFCLGCEQCQANGGRCVQKDDMAEILAKMIDADVIVLASPVYFYTIDAQMKTVIDRTVPRYTEISGKQFYLIIAAADTSLPHMERTIESFRGFLSCLNNAEERGIVYGVGAWKKGDVKALSCMAEAFEFGRNV